MIVARKLQLTGHVHGSPERKIQSYYSWPQGSSLKEVDRLVAGFRKAFSDGTVALERMNTIYYG